MDPSLFDGGVGFDGFDNGYATPPAADSGRDVFDDDEDPLFQQMDGDDVERKQQVSLDFKDDLAEDELALGGNQLGLDEFAGSGSGVGRPAVPAPAAGMRALPSRGGQEGGFLMLSSSLPIQINPALLRQRSQQPAAPPPQQQQQQRQQPQGQTRPAVPKHASGAYARDDDDLDVKEALRAPSRRDDEEAEIEKRIVPPHTLRAKESYWSFAKAKYIEEDPQESRRSVAGVRFLSDSAYMSVRD